MKCINLLMNWRLKNRRKCRRVKGHLRSGTKHHRAQKASTQSSEWERSTRMSESWVKVRIGSQRGGRRCKSISWRKSFLRRVKATKMLSANKLSIFLSLRIWMAKFDKWTSCLIPPLKSSKRPTTTFTWSQISYLTRNRRSYRLRRHFSRRELFFRNSTMNKDN